DYLRDLLSFPTRRSSDLRDFRRANGVACNTVGPAERNDAGHYRIFVEIRARACRELGRAERRRRARRLAAAGDARRERAFRRPGDRKSTRLNSSHVKISY